MAENEIINISLKLRGKGVPHVEIKSWATMIPAKTWNVENVPNELGDVIMELLMSIVEDVTWFLLGAYREMWDERDELK